MSADVTSIPIWGGRSVFAHVTIQRQAPSLTSPPQLVMFSFFLSFFYCWAIEKEEEEENNDGDVENNQRERVRWSLCGQTHFLATFHAI